MSFRDYLTIGEVVQKLQMQYEDLSVSKLRYLEDEELIIPERTAGGYRKYSKDDLKSIELILRLQREKFLPLAVIKQKLDEYDRGLVAPELADILQQEIDKDAHAAQGQGSGIGAAAASMQSTANGAGGNTATSDNYGNAHDFVSDEERYGLKRDETPVVSVAEMIRDEKIPEQFFSELKKFQIVDFPSAGGTTANARLSASDAACVRAAWALNSVGIKPNNLRTYVTFARNEASNFALVLGPTYRHKTPRSKEMLAESCVDIVRQAELMKRYLLQRELRNELGDLL